VQAPAVELNAVAHRYGRRWALRGVSLRLGAGEVLAVMGHNGSGKSTLLRLVATLLRPTRGSGAVYGHDLVGEAGDVRALTGLLGHAPGLYDDLTAAENLAFAARMLGMPDDAGAILAALEAAGLPADAATRERARSLSSGMRRRVALARAMLQRPRLLLLDEPYNSFDAGGVALVNDLVRETRERGGAALLVTHELERAAGVYDRMVELEAGLLLPHAGEPGAAPESEGAIPLHGGAAGRRALRAGGRV
jgi:heme exporter protein A